MQMHHGKDENDISVLGIDYAVGKTPSLTPTYAVFNDRPCLWETENVLNARMNFHGEIGTKPGFAIFVIVD